MSQLNPLPLELPPTMLVKSEYTCGLLNSTNR